MEGPHIGQAILHSLAVPIVCKAPGHRARDLDKTRSFRNGYSATRAMSFWRQVLIWFVLCFHTQDVGTCTSQAQPGLGDVGAWVVDGPADDHLRCHNCSTPLLTGKPIWELARRHALGGRAGTASLKAWILFWGRAPRQKMS